MEFSIQIKSSQVKIRNEVRLIAILSDFLILGSVELKVVEAIKKAKGKRRCRREARVVSNDSKETSP